MKRKFILGILMVSFTLFACKQEASIEDIVENLIGKDFDFCNKIPKEKSTSIYKHKIVSYIDSTGCVRCKLRLEEWSRLKADFGDRTCIIFIACPSIIKDLKHLFKADKFNPDILIADSMETIKSSNSIPNDLVMQTFLLNEKNEIVCVGNPVHNKNVKELFYKRLKQQ